MNNVLVAGGAGYIGSHTVKCLIEKGYKVVVLDNLITGHVKSLDGEVKYYYGDIADRGEVINIVKSEKIEAVIHFAASSIVHDSIQHPDYYFTENVAKTNRFLASLLMGGVDKIVFSSTAAVYGTPEFIPVEEKAVAKPVNPYGVSKLMIEQMLDWMQLSYGMRYIVLRYFNAAGAMLDGSLGEDHLDETHLIPLILKTALGQREAMKIFGTDYQTADGTCIRDYVHVLDLAEAHIAALEGLDQGFKREVYNVGTGSGFSVRQVMEQAKRITNINFLVEESSRRAGDPDVLVAKVDKIQRDLGWTPRNSQLETIIQSAWEWHRKHPLGYRGDFDAGK
ncbi:MAG: UDP-glucose 4-epimerase GalE [Peptococcaceae bacterium]|nr:UDP-glucose 4-epimerase GalE [Peptococcaceae bacterium]